MVCGDKEKVPIDFKYSFCYIFLDDCNDSNMMKMMIVIYLTVNGKQMVMVRQII